MIETVISSQSVIVALYVLSCLALAIILEKSVVLFFLHRLCGTETLSKLIKAEVASPAEGTRQPAIQFLLSLENGEIPAIARQRIMERLSARISWLGTISTIAPMLGLLGTVTGMIKSFAAFDHNSVQTLQLISGIDEALFTTSLGLMIAIPALIAYNWLAGRANRFLDELELIEQNRPEKGDAS
jgi:biopolymer transport protein ExbB